MSQDESSPTEARRAIFAALAQRLAADDFRLDISNTRGGASFSGIEFSPESGMFARLSQDMQGQLLRYSIAIHAMEVRIGVLAPKSMEMLLPFNSDEFAERLQAYPAYGSGTFPQIMSRPVGNGGGWYDFVFANRYTEIATRALAGDRVCQLLLADSLAHELLIISHAFELLLARYLQVHSGYLPEAVQRRNFSLIRFWSEKTRTQLLEEYGLDRLTLAVGREPSDRNRYGEYMLLIPPEGAERERLENLWSTIAANEYLVDPNNTMPGKA